MLTTARKPGTASRPVWLRFRTDCLTYTAAVAAVTTAAYEYAGIARGFLPGRPADAVFFRADPRDDPKTLLDPVLVLRRGRVVVDRR